MTSARPVLPTDLLTLVTYRGRSYHNEAYPRERLGAPEAQNTLGVVLDQFMAFTRLRSAWISVRRQRLQGLVGARRRGGRQAWEIDYLIDATQQQEAVPGLLDCAISEAGRAGAEKLFLRLESDSPLLEVVRRAGFIPYREEVLLARFAAPVGASDSGLREATPADNYQLFRLYNQTAPEAERRHEAATYSEWNAAQERRWLKGGVELLSEASGGIACWLRGARSQHGMLVDVAATQAGSARALDLIAAAERALQCRGTPVYVLLPQHDAAMARVLLDAGFAESAAYISLMRRTRHALSLPKVLPAMAKNPVGA